MAITASRTMSDFAGFITPAQAGEIFADARRQSALMRLVPEMPLGANGVAITTTTSKPSAAWVGEAGQKAASQGGKSLSTIMPKKLAAICVNSKEVVRANPGGYITGLYGDLAEAFAVAFDYAGFFNLGGDGTGTGPFTDAINDTTKTVEFGTAANAYLDVIAALDLLVKDGRKLTGFAFGDVAEPVLLSAVDANKRPLFVPDIANTNLDPATTAAALLRRGSIIGRPCYVGDGISEGATLGFTGNWTKARWGVVGGISYSVSTEATVTINGTLVSLFENNLVAILAEAEYGFVMSDPDEFVAFTDAIS